MLKLKVPGWAVGKEYVTKVTKTVSGSAGTLLTFVMGNVTRTLRIVANLGTNAITVKLEPGAGVKVDGGLQL